MGNCVYCGEPAGIFRSKHKECYSKYKDGTKNILSIISSTVKKEERNPQQTELEIKKIATGSNIDDQKLRELCITGWEEAVETAFDDGVLSEKQEKTLTELKTHFGFSQNDLDEKGSYSKVVKGSMLRSLLEGEIPQRLEVEGHLPFNFQKSETLVWVFSNVQYFEEKSRSKFVGGSKGVSVRVARGVYYRTGGFQGQRIQSTETVHSDTGLLGVTTKHIYFTGPRKSFRINYNKIVSFEPFEDGIGLQKDSASAKPQKFITGDGWFTYNLIVNISRLESS